MDDHHDEQILEPAGRTTDINLNFLWKPVHQRQALTYYFFLGAAVYELVQAAEANSDYNSNYDSEDDKMHDIMKKYQNNSVCQIFPNISRKAYILLD